MFVVPELGADAQDPRASRLAAGCEAEREYLTMAKRAAAPVAPDLTVRERVLLFRAASNTDWEHAGVPGETVTAMVVKGLIERDAGGRLDLTDRGRAALRAVLPEL